MLLSSYSKILLTGSNLSKIILVKHQICRSVLSAILIYMWPFYPFIAIQSCKKKVQISFKTHSRSNQTTCLRCIQDLT